MQSENYRKQKKEIWQGRVDSETNYHSFRWHQVMELLDLTDTKLEPFTGKLGFAFIGFCCDEGVKKNKGRAGAAKGPESIRIELANLPCCFSEEVRLFDAGNVSCEGISLEESQRLLSEAVQKTLELNLFPVVLGGGHELALGHYNGILNYLSRGGNQANIGIINFDAHFDIRPYQYGGNSGTMFRQIHDICMEKNLNYSYLCLGVQKHSNTIELFEAAGKMGVEYTLARDMLHCSDYSTLEKINDFVGKRDFIYLTICSDVFSTAFAPGVSASQPLGLDPENVLILMKQILKSKKVISFDIAEVSLRFDQDNVTSNLAAVLIFALVNTITELHDLSID